MKKNLTHIFLKSRRGIYKNTPENRRLKRVGQPYGSKKEEESTEEQRFNARTATLEKRGLNPRKVSSLEEFAGNKEREAFRERLITENVAKAKKPADGSTPKAVFTLGGAASGKSSSLRKLGYDSIGCEINPDNFQEAENGFLNDNVYYNTMNPKSGAARLHEEAGQMAKEVYKRVLKSGGEFIKDGVLGNHQKALKYIEDAIEHGYDPVIVGVALDTEEAIARNKARYKAQEVKKKNSGRFVKKSILREGHATAPVTFFKLAEAVSKGELPKLKIKLFDNNVARGEEPVLIYDSESKPRILDEEKVKRFLAKTGLPITDDIDLIKSIMKEKSDFVKSFDKYLGGELDITIDDLLEKYEYQKLGADARGMLTVYAKDEDGDVDERLLKKYKAMEEWIMDGKSTGIESDEDYIRLHTEHYGFAPGKLEWK